MVMQYIPSGTLQDLVRAARPRLAFPPLLRDCALQQIHAERYATMRTDAGCLPLEEQIVALVGLFSALEYLAAVPMIHRDVKPVRITGPAASTSARPSPSTLHTREHSAAGYACPS